MIRLIGDNMTEPTHEQYLITFRVKTACYSFGFCLIMIPLFIVIPGFFPNIVIPREGWELLITLTSGLLGYIIGSSNQGLPKM